MVDASPAGGLGLELLAWDETDDPFACSPAATARPRVGARPGGGRARSWAEHALGVQRALPGSALEIASPVIDRLRMVKSAEIEARARRRGDRPGARPDGRLAAPGAPRPRSAPISPKRSSPRGTRGWPSSIVGSGPNGADPHHELSDRHGAGRRHRRRRHRRAPTTGLPVGLHPHLHHRRSPDRRSGASGTRSCRPRTGRRRRGAPGVTAEQVDAAARG